MRIFLVLIILVLNTGCVSLKEHVADPVAYSVAKAIAPKDRHNHVEKDCGANQGDCPLTFEEIRDIDKLIEEVHADAIKADEVANRTSENFSAEDPFCQKWAVSSAESVNKEFCERTFREIAIVSQNLMIAVEHNDWYMVRENYKALHFLYHGHQSNVDN